MEQRINLDVLLSKEVKLKDLERLAVKYGLNFEEIQWTFNQAGRNYFLEKGIKTPDEFQECLNFQYGAALKYIKYHVDKKMLMGPK